MDTPTIEPAILTAGDTLKFQRSVSGFSAADGWVVSYVLANASARYTFTATAAGADHLVTVAASVTAAWLAGRYAWEAYAQKAGERYRIAGGALEVRANLAADAPGDTRSHARRTLDAIEAVIERRAARDQEEYSIDGRSLKRTPVADLMRLRQLYRGEVAREEQAARLARGLDSGRRLHVRFMGPR